MSAQTYIHGAQTKNQIKKTYWIYASFSWSFKVFVPVP